MAGMSTADLVAAWQKPFLSVADGGCSPQQESLPWPMAPEQVRGETLQSEAVCPGKGESLCESNEPLCQFCGKGGSHMPHSWEPCLTNSSAGVGACPFPVVAATAMYNGLMLAKSSRVRLVENNYYFPREDMNMSLLTEHGGKTYQCTWKGECYYYSLAELPDAMWSYETRGAGKCRGHPGCPSAYTCGDILNYGSFDPRVAVTVEREGIDSPRFQGGSAVII